MRDVKIFKQYQKRIRQYYILGRKVKEKKRMDDKHY